MDDATLLKAFEVLARGIDRAAGPEPGLYPGTCVYTATADRIRALKPPPTEAPKSTRTDTLTAQIIQAIDDAARLDCECGESHFVRDSRYFYCANPHCGKRGGSVQQDPTATIDDLSDPVVPGSRERWGHCFAKPVHVAGIEDISESLARAAKERIDFIMRNREKLVEAWVAETGAMPVECELLEQKFQDGRCLVTVQRRDGRPANYQVTRDLQNKLSAARAIVNRGLVEVSIPSCVKETGKFCGDGKDGDPECPHEDVPDWLCLCGQAPGCGNPDCIGDKLWQAVNGAYVVDLVGLLIKTLPELPPDLEQEVAAALKAIGAR